jgi:hypothetical protein
MTNYCKTENNMQMTVYKKTKLKQKKEFNLARNNDLFYDSQIFTSDFNSVTINSSTLNQ